MHKLRSEPPLLFPPCGIDDQRGHMFETIKNCRYCDVDQNRRGGMIFKYKGKHGKTGLDELISLSSRGPVATFDWSTELTWQLKSAMTWQARKIMWQVDTCHLFLEFLGVLWGCFQVPRGTTHRVTHGRHDVSNDGSRLSAIDSSRSRACQ